MPKVPERFPVPEWTDPDGDRDTSFPPEQTRRFQQWAVGNRELSPVRKLLLHTILLRTDGRSQRPCFASFETLAGWMSCGRATVYKHARKARRAGHLRKGNSDRSSPNLWVTVVPTEAEESSMWSLRQEGGLPEPEPRLDWRRGWFGTFGDVGRPLRLWWERALPRANLKTSIKGVAFALGLLMNSRGVPFRKTTNAELRRWSGYSSPTTVRKALDQLEDRGWLWVIRKRGRAGGITPFLRLPDPEIEQMLNR